MENQNQFILDSLEPLRYIDSNGEISEIDVKSLLEVNRNNLPLDTLPATYLFISQESDKRRLIVDNLKVKLDSVGGDLRNKYVNDSTLRNQNGGKKPPEAMLTAAINSDETYIELAKKLNKANYALRITTHLLKACEQKASLMQTLSAENRAQRQFAPGGNNISAN